MTSALPRNVAPRRALLQICVGEGAGRGVDVRAKVWPMAKAYQCPACTNEVDRAAAVCSNPACRRELAWCSHCRDVTTYTLVEKGSGRFDRDRFKCDRCERSVVKCMTWTAGGYCNGLARVGERMGAPLCASCNERAFDVGRSVLGWTVMTAVGGLLKRRK